MASLPASAIERCGGASNDTANELPKPAPQSTQPVIATSTPAMLRTAFAPTTTASRRAISMNGARQ